MPSNRVISAAGHDGDEPAQQSDGAGRDRMRRRAAGQTGGRRVRAHGIVRALLLSLTASGAAGLTAVATAQEPAQRQMTRVPSVIGLTASEAQQRLRGVGLGLGRVDTLFTSDRRGLGAIIRQAPAPGNGIAVRGAVNVTIALPPPPRSTGDDVAVPPPQVGPRPPSGDAAPTPSFVVVPRLIGQHVNAAPGILQPNLVLGELTEADRFAVRAGIVLDQRPRPNDQARPNSAVHVLVASARTQVPSLIGVRQEAAADTLAKYQLRPGTARRVPSEATPRTVVQQLPVAGSVVRKGTPVSVDIAGPPEEPLVRVPDLVGKSIETAETLVAAAALQLDRPTVRDAFEVRKGIVLQQNPPGQAEAKRGTVVHVTIASEWTEVPRITGMPEAEAATALRTRQLTGRQRAVESADAASGTVINVDPLPTTRVLKDSDVSIEIATPALVAVPNLVGTDSLRAREIVTGAGLNLGSIRVRDQFEAADGIVLDQSPVSGSRAPRGSAITVSVASQWTEVPPIAGMREVDATAAVRSRRLELSRPRAVPTADATPGTVIGVTPAPSSRVLKGSPVAVDLAAPPTPVVAISVPRVIGSDSAAARRTIAAAQPTQTVVPLVTQRNILEAERLLSDARLRVGTISWSDAAVESAGIVVSQTPGPGQEAAFNSAVNLVLASDSTSVPQLTGLTLGEAERLLLQANLVLREVSRPVGDAAAETIESQNPQPGTRLPKRSAVEVTRSATVVPDSNLARVPDLIGLSRVEAEARLDAVGLSLREVDRIRDSEQRAGTVAAQTPAADQVVARGTAVEVNLAAAGFPPLAAGLAALLVAAAGTLGYRRIKRNGKRPPEPEKAEWPTLTYEPKLSRAAATLRAERELASSPTLELLGVPNLELSSFKLIYGSAIIAEPKR